MFIKVKKKRRAQGRISTWLEKSEKHSDTKIVRDLKEQNKAEQATFLWCDIMDAFTLKMYMYMSSRSNLIIPLLNIETKR